MRELDAATARLAAAGIPSPRVDAELLLAHVLAVPRSRLLTRTVPLDPATAARLDELAARRAAREPLQHLLGTAPFRYLELAVGPGVFVPRPETELLVDAAMADLRALPSPVVVDLCSGTGALALAVAAEVPAARVVAVEADPDALTWLRRNAATCPGSRVDVRAGDVTDAGVLAELAGAVDVVLSNPPYAPTGTEVDPEVRADPRQAVFAGPDGLAVIPSVIARAATLLRPGALLVMEHDDTQASAVARLLAGAAWEHAHGHRDLSGRDRFVTARRRQ